MKPKHKLPPWLAPKRQQDMIIGVVWYTTSEWSKTKASATDPERFEETYEEWLQVAKKGAQRVQSARAECSKIIRQIRNSTGLVYCKRQEERRYISVRICR